VQDPALVPEIIRLGPTPLSSACSGSLAHEVGSAGAVLACGVDMRMGSGARPCLVLPILVRTPVASAAVCALLPSQPSLLATGDQAKQTGVLAG